MKSYKSKKSLKKKTIKKKQSKKLSKKNQMIKNYYKSVRKLKKKIKSFTN